MTILICQLAEFCWWLKTINNIGDGDGDDDNCNGHHHHDNQLEHQNQIIINENLLVDRSKKSSSSTVIVIENTQPEQYLHTMR